MNYVLTEKDNPITYYLNFRDFSSSKGIETRENLREIREEEWKVIGDRLVHPNPNSNLWQEDFATGVLLQGFFALWSNKPEDVMLYEIRDVTLPKRDTFEAGAVFANRILRDDKEFLPFVTEHKGEGIIKRLVEIPVEARKF